MTDVVIAGGGPIGLSVAWRCAQRGLDVVVIDADGERGAGHAAAGMLAPITEAAYGEEHLLRLCRASLDQYPAFVAELETASGLDVGLRTNGPWTSCTPSMWSWACRSSVSPPARPVAGNRP
jgi:glycine oxidase